MAKMEYINDFVYDWSLQKGENMPNINKKNSFFNSLGLINDSTEKIKLG
jgi:hypothetical protein